MTNPRCLINQDVCGREPGNPVCPRCGLDERVVYPGQADREAAQERAELRYLRAQVKELQASAVKPAAPTPPPAQGRTVGQIFRDAPWAPEMVVIPSGHYLMGSADDDPWSAENDEWINTDERPQHLVKINYEMAIGKYPVTFDQWDACFDAGGVEHRPDDNGWGRGARPVINVSWSDAQEYILWLNRLVGIEPDDPSRYRLPSESEWEYACRAGTRTAYNTPSGLLSPDDATYNANSGDFYEWAPRAGRVHECTTPVGIYAPNAWGLYDMHGNVCEWVQDSMVIADNGARPVWVWDTTEEIGYRGAPSDGSAWETSSPLRVTRGGCWANPPRWLRSGNRFTLRFDHRVKGNEDNDTGFRLARTLL
jgi:formylglycine-generating enzyme required for sulfatase activity